jgi:hypothetical protein
VEFTRLSESSLEDVKQIILFVFNYPCQRRYFGQLSLDEPHLLDQLKTDHLVPRYSLDLGLLQGVHTFVD